MKYPKLSFIRLMNHYPWGGSEELWQRTAKYAAKQGCIVDAHVYDGSEQHPKIVELQKSGIQVFYRKYFAGIVHRIARKMGVMVFDPENYWKNILSDANCLYVISGGSTFDFFHFKKLIDQLKSRKLAFVYISQHNAEHRSFLMEQVKIARDFFSAARTVYFVSKRNLETVQRQIVANIPNSEVVFNPVNVVPQFMEALLPSEKLRFACVARLECADKGQDLLLEVLASDKWKKRNWRVSFYGTCPDEDYLKSLVEYYELENRVQFYGHVKDIRQIWQENDALLMSSLAEGTPLSLMEAMACGRPAVLTDVGGNAEWIEDGHNGFIAAAPTAPLIDATLERFWESRSRLAELGSNAFETFRRKYPNDAIEYFYNRLQDVRP